MTGCPALTSKQVHLAQSNLNGRYALRDRALFTLGIHTGLRISELLALKVGQIWDGQKIIDRLYVNRQDTKGKYAGTSIVLHPEAVKAVSRWIEAGDLTENLQGFLFPSQKGGGRGLGRKSAWEVLHAAFRRTGVIGMAGTHCMRKTFANHVHKALGNDLFRTSKALRHASPLTTLRYLSCNQEEIDQAILAM